MTTLAVTSVNSLLCQVSTCFRMGSKFRCIRSTPTEMQSMSEKDFECLASTGVNTPGTMFPKLMLLAERVVTEDFHRRLPGESDDLAEYRRTKHCMDALTSQRYITRTFARTRRNSSPLPEGSFFSRW